MGDGKGPIDAYLDIADIVRIATEARVDAIHPGYGFLSESPEFAEACAAAGIIFVGPLPDTMRRLGNKVEARNLASAAGVPVMPATPPLPADPVQVLAMAHAVGFPVMLKASWGGGGRGMRIVEDDRELIDTVATARREAKAAFGKDEVYLEKLIRRATSITATLANVSEAEAQAALTASDMHVKTAILVLRLAITAPEASKILEAAGGSLRKALS